jgi:asparagine synthetase B (glutamine-hydrolysing)
MPLQIVKAKPGRMADEFLWAIDLQDEPMGMMAFFPLAMMVRSAKEYGKILLTGDGGDEVFLGYGKPSDWTEKKDNGFGFAGLSDVKVGSEAPSWMGSWGRRVISSSLLGHMFTKLDRATAEQGVEGRCPLLDWDLMMYVRSLKPEQLFYSGNPKALLKAELKDWPQAFIERPKMGFPYRLRWIWALKGFSDFRDLITRDTVDRFESVLPVDLRKTPTQWKNMEILRNFSAAWKLLAWSRFEHRLKLASFPTINHEQNRIEVSTVGV